MVNRLTAIIAVICIFFITVSAYAMPMTNRGMQLSNNKVNVWETVIYPSARQELKMHRHDHDRILVAFNNGVLKVTNNKGKAHYLKLEKNKSYFLSRDIPGELHNDENISSHPIKVLVIELKN